MNENARQADINMTRLFEELNANFVRRMDEMKVTSEKSLEDGNV